MTYGFLFDLDMTLVDSSELETLRARSKWPEVLATLDRIRAFPTTPSPHEVVQQLKREGFPIGVVTNAPSAYAQPVLQRFGIPYDVLIAWHDTTEHKPHPEPLQLALSRLGVEPGDAFYVGDARADVEASYRAEVTSVGAGWGVEDLASISDCAPDVLLLEPAALLKPAHLRRYGYYAERTVRSKRVVPHEGSSLVCGPNEYALGRYFAKKDPRHATSELSQALIEFKDADGPLDSLANALARFIGMLEWERPFWLMSVPAKPGQERDRFAKLLEMVASQSSGVQRCADGLTCTRAIPNYKTMKPDERREAMKGVFSTKYTWKGQRVLLVDDVLTTGSTVHECVRTLRADGAADVRVVALGRDQYAVETKTCPQCSRGLRVRKGRYGQFWGCSGYPNECQYTEDL